MKNFYQGLYKCRDRTTSLQEAMLSLDITNLTRIPDDFFKGYENLLTLEELTFSLNNTKNNKSPGLDGYPIEFFKTFWDQLGPLLLRAANDNFIKNSLSPSQKQGLITCIPKGSKSRKLLKNWRPISLLNSSYKLISSSIANRIKKVLDLII